MTGVHMAPADVPSEAVPPAGRRRRRRRLLVIMALVLAVGAGAVFVVTSRQGTTSTADTAGPAPSPPTGTRLTRADWTGTASGVYQGTDPGDVIEFEQWRGSPVDLVVDFPARDTWQDISSPDYVFQAWAGQRWQLVLSVAMLPTGVQDATIEAGADGRYDEYFRTLAEGLVDAGLGNTILRIGWEFNIAGSRWGTRDAATWVEYWRNIASVMGNVPGNEFRFDWNVNNGPNPVDAVDFYPGDAWVDYIGVDAYDYADTQATYPLPDNCSDQCLSQRRTAAWNDIVFGGSRGLEFWSSFAEQHDKQMSLPEWGVWERPDGLGGGDNADYIQRMADFIADPDNAVGYESYFEDSNSQGTHLLVTDLPLSGRQYRALFGG